MARTYDQFVASGVDNAGLEKLLRLFQSTFMILTSFPILITYLLPSSPISVHVSTETTLRQFQNHLNITRRWLRLFRFLETLAGSWTLYRSPPQPSQGGGRSFDAWLDILSKTCMGLFGMVESLTLLDVAPVDGLEVFGPETTAWMNLEAHKFWFVGLYASAISTGFKLLRLLAYQPVPQTGDVMAPSVSDPKDQDNKEKSVEEEKEEMKRLAEQRREERKVWAKKVGEETTALGLKLLADVLDLTIPSFVLGWVPLSVGTVGLAMWCSTVIAGLAVWKRVGGELDASRA